MPTIIVTNPQRALQVENQQLHRENIALKGQLENLRRELAAVRQGRQVPASAAKPVSVPASVAATEMAAPPSPMLVAQRTPSEAPPVRAAPQRLAPAATPRQVIHLTATAPSAATAVPLMSTAASPRPTRPDVESLDDAAMRFRLLELD